METKINLQYFGHTKDQSSNFVINNKITSIQPDYKNHQSTGNSEWSIISVIQQPEVTYSHKPNQKRDFMKDKFVEICKDHNQINYHIVQKDNSNEYQFQDDEDDFNNVDEKAQGSVSQINTFDPQKMKMKSTLSYFTEQ